MTSIAWTAGRTAAKRTANQPAVLISTAVFYLMVTTALSSVWRVAAETSGGVIVGYTAGALVWYVAAAEACIISMPQRLIYDICLDITSGRVLVEMLRPVPAIISRIAEQLGALLPRLAVCAVIGLTFSTLVGGRALDGTALALAGPALVFAVAINLATQHAFAASGFWLRDAGSAWFLYQKVVFLAGGMLIPLEILPDAVSGVLRYLPFASMAYVPARLASGHAEPELLLVQVGWLIVTILAARAAFRAGERHLMRVGG